MARLDLTFNTEQPPREVTWQGLRLREDTAYTDHKGRDDNSVRRSVEKALSPLAGILQNLLEADEAILYAARANAPMGTFEQLTFGWYAQYVGQTTLVLTDRRLLHLAVTRNGQWKRGVRSLRWGDLQDAKIKGWLARTMELRYASGLQEKYWAIRARDAKKLRVLVPVLRDAYRGQVTARQGMTSLCPECKTALTAGVYQCANCGLVFKDEKTVVRRSLLIPGGGYFYTGQHFLGVMDVIAEGYLLLLIAAFVLLAFLGDEPAAPGEEALTTLDALVFAGFIGFLLALEKLITIHHCRRLVRNFIPTTEKRLVTPSPIG
jgi:hypothetical protein